VICIFATTGKLQADGGATVTPAAFWVGVGAIAWSASNWIADHVIYPVFRPPPEAMNINGTTVQQTDRSDIQPQL